MSSSAWRAVLRLGQCLVLVLTASAVTLAYPAPAQADWDGFRPYTYGGASCTSGDFKDPLNYFFNTTNHNLGLESVAKGYIRYWPVYWSMPPEPADDQYMWSTNSGCHRQDDQLAEVIFSPKYHSRLRQGPWIPGWGYATAVGMHHDSIGWCGWFFHDVSDSFNSARNFAYGKFRDAGFSQGHYYIGNTMGMTQCDGRVTASDGWVWENHGY